MKLKPRYDAIIQKLNEQDKVSYAKIENTEYYK